MSKYAPLGDYLARQKTDTISLSFADVEKILEFKLPQSAYRQRAWWSNNPHNNVMTNVWRRAEFRSQEVDMQHQKVVFQRKKNPPSPPPLTAAELQERNKQLRERIAANREQHEPRHHPLRGALKGTLRIVGGTDVAAPVGAWKDR